MYNNIKKFFFLWAVFSLLYAGTLFAAPSFIYQRTVLPEVDSTYELSTSTQAWLRANVDEICLTGDTCRTTWPTGGGSGVFPFSADRFVCGFNYI